MADLSINLKGLKLKNPIMPASGPIVRNADCILECARNGVGALVTKTVSIDASSTPRPYIQEIEGGLLNTALWSEHSVQYWVRSEYSRCKASGLPLIISIGYTVEEIEKIIPLISPFADAVELVTNYTGEDINHVLQALNAANEINKPVFMKLSPGIPNTGWYAKKLVEEGAAGFSVINSLGPCLNIDIETGMPFLGNSSGYTWLTGKAIKPLAMRYVYEIANSVKVPIIGAGGISCGADVIEMFMAGASAVQICTAAMSEGPSIFQRIINEVNDWLDAHNYSSINDIKGLAIDKIKTRKYINSTIVPTINKDLCTSCEICSKTCPYKAIHMKHSKAEISSEDCYGCGLCVTKCPVKAIHLNLG